MVTYLTESGQCSELSRNCPFSDERKMKRDSRIDPGCLVVSLVATACISVASSALAEDAWEYRKSRSRRLLRASARFSQKGQRSAECLGFSPPHASFTYPMCADNTTP